LVPLPSAAKQKFDGTIVDSHVANALGIDIVFDSELVGDNDDNSTNANGKDDSRNIDCIMRIAGKRALIV